MLEPSAKHFAPCPSTGIKVHTRNGQGSPTQEFLNYPPSKASPRAVTHGESEMTMITTAMDDSWDTVSACIHRLESCASSRVSRAGNLKDHKLLQFYILFERKLQYLMRNVKLVPQHYYYQCTNQNRMRLRRKAVTITALLAK